MSPTLRLSLLLVVLLFLALRAAGAGGRGDETGELRGTVRDPSGAAVPGASVRVEGRATARTRADTGGGFRLRGLPTGRYRVLVTHPGFSRFALEGVDVTGNETPSVDAALAVAPVRESLVVRDGGGESPPAGAVVLEGALLEALPDDPAGMIAALAALAGAVPGHTPPVIVDGFEGGRVPPKSAIRMVRLNASPYSAEYEYPGLGRIEIFTKPGGGDGLHGHVQVRAGGRALDARDPFASGETPDYRRLAGSGSIGGPLVRGRASFFLDGERSADDASSLVNAVVLGPGLSPAERNESLAAPHTRTTVSPRVDALIGRHALTARYSYAATIDERSGVGGFSLPSRAVAAESRQHVLQAGDTFSTGRLSHEIRAQWTRRQDAATPASLAPALVVQDAFLAGGAEVGRSGRTQDRLEMHDVVSWTLGAHAFRAGLRVRHGSVRDESRLASNGVVTFAGGVGPALDPAGGPVLDASGRPVLVPLTSLERYRRTLALAALGLSPAEVRALGGGASQLRIAGGEPLAAAGQWNVALFAQDEWRALDDLTVGLGMRAEAQPSLGRELDLAPRASFSWTPGRRGTAAPRTVVRGGVGLFYERIAEALFLDAKRLGGAAARRVVVTDDADVLDLVRFDPSGDVAAVPAVAGLAAHDTALRRLADDLRVPATLAASVSVDHGLRPGLTISAQWTHTTTWRALRSRVVAPAAGGPLAYQYESTGRARADQLMLGASRFGRRVGFTARYFLSYGFGDTDGPASFPASSADPAADWGRASGDVRHRLVLTGSILLPAGLRLSPLLVASSGAPYDVTLGRDVDGDTVFAERPARAADPSRPGVIATPFGLLDTAPDPGATTVPRNLGEAPGFVGLNLRLSRGFRLGSRGAGGRPSGPELSVSLYAQNVLDRVNPGPPVGNLASPWFGRSSTAASGAGGVAAGHRSVELQVGTSF